MNLQQGIRVLNIHFDLERDFCFFLDIELMGYGIILKKVTVRTYADDYEIHLFEIWDPLVRHSEEAIEFVSPKNREILISLIRAWIAAQPFLNSYLKDGIINLETSVMYDLFYSSEESNLITAGEE